MPGRKCSICNHPKRNEIDKSLSVNGASLRAIAVRFRVSKDSVKRHMDNGHISDKVIKHQQVSEMIEVDDFLTHVQKKRARFKQMAEEAQKDADPHRELKVYQVESKFTEIEGKALGAFREKVEHSGSIEMIGQMSDDEVVKRARSILTKQL